MLEGENYPITLVKKITINILTTNVELKYIIKLKCVLNYSRYFFLPLFF